MQWLLNLLVFPSVFGIPVSKAHKVTCRIKNIPVENSELDDPNVKTPRAHAKHFESFMN